MYCVRIAFECAFKTGAMTCSRREVVVVLLEWGLRTAQWAFGPRQYRRDAVAALASVPFLDPDPDPFLARVLSLLGVVLVLVHLHRPVGLSQAVRSHALPRPPSYPTGPRLLKGPHSACHQE